MSDVTRGRHPTGSASFRPWRTDYWSAYSLSLIGAMAILLLWLAIANAPANTLWTFICLGLALVGIRCIRELARRAELYEAALRRRPPRTPPAYDQDTD